MPLKAVCLTSRASWAGYVSTLCNLTNASPCLHLAILRLFLSTDALRSGTPSADPDTTRRW